MTGRHVQNSALRAGVPPADDRFGSAGRTPWRMPPCCVLGKPRRDRARPAWEPLVRGCAAGRRFRGAGHSMPPKSPRSGHGRHPEHPGIPSASALGCQGLFGMDSSAARQCQVATGGRPSPRRCALEHTPIGRVHEVNQATRDTVDRYIDLVVRRSHLVEVYPNPQPGGRARERHVRHVNDLD
jgi:hypothetical protein